MIYTQTYIDSVIDDAFCCMGDLGIKINKKMRLGIDTSAMQRRMRRLYLYTWALSRWEQDEDGSNADDNVITEAERDTLIEGIKSLCCCGGSTTTSNLSSGYWTDGYIAEGYIS